MENALFTHKSIMVALILMSFGAAAEDGTAWDLDNLQTQRVLYKARAEVNKAKAEAEGRDFGATTVTPTMNGNASVNAAPVGDVLPQLIKVNGRNAVISMSDGNSTTVTVGQMLPGGRWQVLSIGLGGVKIKNISTQKTQVLN
ncbi:type IV pilus biogenesis protein PilP [Escherichia coli]|nr:type IV pilus biogenesis protein PilP [Escherichia coli]